MKIPSLFYGRASDVRARVKKLARSIVRRRDFSLFASDLMLDTSEFPCFVLVMGDDSAPGENFHVGTLGRALMEAAPRGEVRQFMADWILWSLEEDWRFISVLSEGASQFLVEHDRSMLLKYVDAADRSWPGLTSLGARFGPFSHGKPYGIFTACSALWRALALLGVPRSMMGQPFDGKPSDLLKFVGSGN